MTPMAMSMRGSAAIGTLAVCAFLFLSVVAGQGLELTLTFTYPDSSLPSQDAILTLRGNSLGLSWTSGVNMQQNANNEWSYTLSYTDSDVGNVLEVKPLINDKIWSIGANFMISLQSYSSSLTLYPWFYSQQGEYGVLPVEIYSPQLQNYRSLVIYLPPSYNENFLKPMTNVLVMHDGQNLFNASTSFLGIAWDYQDTINPVSYTHLTLPTILRV
eukprot:TRINITY_DN838_c0_g1_i3.p1 TRINITY_DN838_c0_g1~~TRINITY_DN838_c0_g1_i3.p1  ORF type:complete len:215 (-),score=37.18 TRINITY_DN838_c0_g1_i3:19-663(-)